MYLRLIYGGERGIRTPGGFLLNGFQDRRFRPLSQLSIYSFSNFCLYPRDKHGMKQLFIAPVKLSLKQLRRIIIISRSPSSLKSPLALENSQFLHRYVIRN
jgi:hypothetical protein